MYAVYINNDNDDDDDISDTELENDAINREADYLEKYLNEVNNVETNRNQIR